MNDATHTASPIEGEGPFREAIPLPSEDDPDSSFHHEVIIAGAGPAGLLLGCRLREMGIDVALVDPHLSAGTGGSKAAITMPRSLEAMGPEVADQLHGKQGSPTGIGRRVWGVRLGSGKSWIGRIFGFSIGVGWDDKNYEASELGCRYGPLAIGQDDVERALADRYRELGGTVYRAARVTSVEEDVEGVSVGVERFVYVRPPAKAPEMPDHLTSTSKSTVLRARFVVGADGKNSLVRGAVGLGYDGKEYSHLFFLVDLLVKEGEPERCGWGAAGDNSEEEAARAYFDVDGTLVLLVRMGGTKIRAYYARDGIDRADCTEAFLRSEWRRILPGDDGLEMEIEKFESPSVFNVGCRLASSYSSPGGRVLLAGDAAHCHSPAGGQGMNTSLQDSYNLAWKLAEAVKRNAGGNDPLLATYESERMPVAKWVLSSTDAIFADMTRPSSPLLSKVRNVFIRLVLKLAPTGSLPPRFTRDKVFGLSISYRDAGTCVDSGEGGTRGFLGRWMHTPKLVAGDRLPDLRFHRRGKGSKEYLYDLIGRRSCRHTLIVVTDGETTIEEEKGALSACVAAASKMSNVSNTIFVVGREGTRPKPLNEAEEKGCGGGDEVELVDLEAPPPGAASLSDLLGLGSAGIAVIAVRPDTYMSFVCRGTCSLANIEESLRGIAPPHTSDM